MADSHVYFFGGGDPAPSEGARSDDGAIVTLRAQPRIAPQENEQLSQMPSDWLVDCVHARRIRGASSRQWSGIIHAQHANFGYNGFVLDAGGGGQWIKRDLANGRQLINSVETECLPIVTRDDTSVVQAQFILTMFKRGDPGIELLWPEMAGDDVLKDVAFASLKDALDNALIGFPPPYAEWKREQVSGWSEERQWALKNLSALYEQLKNIYVMTKEDGSFVFTKRNARQFDSKGKKDFVSALINAWVAFLIWLKDNDGCCPNRVGDKSMCSIFDPAGFAALQRIGA